MGKEVTLAEYTDEQGTPHNVCGQWDSEIGAWRVIDISPDSREIVDTLLGVGDDARQVDAVARDYAREMTRWLLGERPTHPLRPKETATQGPEQARAEHPRPARANHQPIAA